MQCFADCFERGKSNRAYFASFYFGKIHVCNADFFREFSEGNFPVRHHPIKTQDYHISPSTSVSSFSP